MRCFRYLTVLVEQSGYANRQDIMACEPLGLHLFAAVAALTSKLGHHEIIGKIQHWY
jgi:hypothetical protein